MKELSTVEARIVTLMDLQDKIKSLNEHIKEVNLINRASNQIEELKHTIGA